MTTSLNTSIQPRVRTIGGVSIRFAESEPRAEHALLLNPWPESIFAFDQVWDRLAERTHLVAIDLPGFGHSGSRDDVMSPRAMGEFIIRVADAFGLEKPHAVGPDVGTAALLFAAADHPDRFTSIVLGSGGASFPLQLGGRLNDWVVTPDISAFWTMDPRAIVSGAITGVERYSIPDAVREDYLSAYEGDRFVNSMRYVRAYPTELPILAELLPLITTPVQIIGGLWDWAVPPSNHRYLYERLPNAKLDLLDAGHFTWEDAADEYTALVTDWWAGGHGEAALATPRAADLSSLSAKKRL